MTDWSCPHCGAMQMRRTDMSTLAIPEPLIEIWTCDVCGRRWNEVIR